MEAVAVAADAAAGYLPRQPTQLIQATQQQSPWFLLLSPSVAEQQHQQQEPTAVVAVAAGFADLGSILLDGPASTKQQ